MATGFDPSGRLPAVFTGNTGTSSFTDFLSVAAPELLPGRRALPPGFTADLTHGTTIVSLTYADGVIMAGDRRATMGNLVANRDIEKVYAADPYSLVGVAGTAGVGIELIRLYQVELEHYEKIEGTMLSLDGKANRLATMIRNNLPAAMQGLAVVPIFAGYDLDAVDPTRAGRLFSFDVAGGIYEETGYDGIGSGSLFAKSALKKRYRPGMARDEAIRIAVESLYDAADDDTATGGPDPIRKIYPIIMSATADGAVRLTDEESGAVSEAVIAARREQPGG